MKRSMYHWERTGEHEYAAGNGAHVWSSNRGITWWAYSGRRRIGECTELYGAMALAEVDPEPINPEVHAHMLEMGYSYQYYPVYEEGGDAENGPGLVVPDYDEYTSQDDVVIIDQGGHFAHFEKRDLELEKWIDEQQGAMISYTEEDAHATRH